MFTTQPIAVFGNSFAAGSASIVVSLNTLGTYVVNVVHAASGLRSNVTLTVVVGNPAIITAIALPPASAGVNVFFSPSYAVADMAGNPSSNTTVTFNGLPTGPISVQSDANGVASFTNLSVAVLGTYTYTTTIVSAANTFFTQTTQTVSGSHPVPS